MKGHTKTPPGMELFPAVANCLCAHTRTSQTGKIGTRWRDSVNGSILVLMLHYGFARHPWGNPGEGTRNLNDNFLQPHLNLKFSPIEILIQI